MIVHYYVVVWGASEAIGFDFQYYSWADNMILHYCVVVWGTSETIGLGYFNLKVRLVIVTEYYSWIDNIIQHYCMVVWGMIAIIFIAVYDYIPIE